MKSKHLGKLAGAVATALIAVAMAAPLAQADTPNPGYSQFAGCKSHNENPEMSTCLRVVVNSGNFKMGNKNVTIEKPITLIGGTNQFLGNFSYTSQGGMLPVNQKVPGGIIGLTGLTWLFEFFGSEALTLYAATELAGQPVFHGFEQVDLPVKVHLIHSLLGKNCYVGSTSNPIQLKLKPSKEPEAVEVLPGEIFFVKNAQFADKTFSAPGASGCVLTLFGFIPISINGLVNAQSGLPSASGNNETVQNQNVELVDNTLVYP